MPAGKELRRPRPRSGWWSGVHWKRTDARMLSAITATCSSVYRPDRSELQEATEPSAFREMVYELFRPAAAASRPLRISGGSPRKPRRSRFIRPPRGSMLPSGRCIRFSPAPAFSVRTARVSSACAAMLWLLAREMASTMPEETRISTAMTIRVMRLRSRRIMLPPPVSIPVPG